MSASSAMAFLVIGMKIGSKICAASTLSMPTALCSALSCPRCHPAPSACPCAAWRAAAVHASAQDSPRRRERGRMTASRDFEFVRVRTGNSSGSTPSLLAMISTIRRQPLSINCRKSSAAATWTLLRRKTAPRDKLRTDRLMASVRLPFQLQSTTHQMSSRGRAGAATGRVVTGLMSMWRQRRPVRWISAAIGARSETITSASKSRLASKT